MRILFIVTKFPSPTETFVEDQARLLVESGHQVDFLAEEPHQSLSSSRGNYRTFYFGSPKRKLKNLLGILTLKKNSRFFKTLRGAFLEGPPLLTFRNLRLSLPLINEVPYDLIHAHFGPNGIRATALRNILYPKAPVICSFYGYDVSSFVHGNGTDVYRCLFEETRELIVLSEDMSEKLRAIGAPPHKLSVVPFSIDVKPQITRLNSTSPLKCLSAGRLVEKKGFHHSIRAVAQIAKKGIPIRYTIIGEGPLRDSLMKLIHELDLLEVVFLSGAKSRDDCRQAMMESDILIVPSTTSGDGDQEGTPMVILEGMSAGIAIIGTRHAGIPEMIRNGETGLICEPGNETELARAIQRLQEDSGLKEKLGLQARADAAKNRGPQKMLEKLLEIYKK